MSRWHKTGHIVHMAVSCHGGRRSGRKTPPHSFRRVSVARSTRWTVRLSSRSHPVPSTSSSAASPMRLRTLAPAGVQGNHAPAAPARLCRAARDACLVEYSCQPCCAGVCSAPHHRQHVARRSATTSASVLVHDCKTCCTCFAKLTGAGPYHVLTGTVALFRTGKRLLVV